ncbi:hypothetical protein [Pontibacter chitinilyticus]|uniref:hypothetical protein n=1 Tax=Pontibacter chitinilyticus TaxID=2674989 RepID=UPI00321AA877
MNNTSIRRALYLLAALMIAGGILVRVLHHNADNLDLHLILAGHLLILAGIFIHMKQVTEEQKSQEPRDKHLRQLNN